MHGPVNVKSDLFLLAHRRCIGLLLHLITLSDTHTNARARAVGLLWTSDQPVAETSNQLHTTFPRQTSMPAAGFEPAITAN